MAQKCFRKLADDLAFSKPELKAFKEPNPKDIFKTKAGIIDINTTFAKKRRGTLGFKYKAWTKRKGIPYIAKGNKPLLYERAFLETLEEADFEKLQTLGEKAAVAPAPMPKIAARASDKVAVEFRASGKAVKKVKMQQGINQSEQWTMKDGKKYLVKDASMNDAAAERLYTDLAGEMDLEDMVAKTGEIGAGDRQGTIRTIQEWVKGWEGGYEANIDMLENFALKTKKGHDWTMLDWLLQQEDRYGNMMVKYGEKGFIQQVKLIDNGMAMGQYGTNYDEFFQIVLDKKLKLDPKTAGGLKKFAKKMGWREGIKDWNIINKNIDDWFGKYKWEPGAKHAVQIDRGVAFKARIRGLIESDFTFGDALVTRVSELESIYAAGAEAAPALLEQRVAVAQVADVLKARVVKLEQQIVAQAAKPKPIPKISVRVSDKVKREFVKAGKATKKVEMQGGINFSERWEMKNGKKYLVKDVPGGEGAVERMYTDFAKEIDSDIVAKTAEIGTYVEDGVSTAQTAQEWVTGGFTTPADLKAGKGGLDMHTMVHEFALKTKKGNDWVVQDWLFQQGDRHYGNFMIKGNWSGTDVLKGGKWFTKKGVKVGINDIMLIDNGMAMTKAETQFYKESLGALNQNLKLNKGTVKGLKSFAKKMGYIEGAEDWRLITRNIDNYFSKYQMEAGAQHAVKGSVEGFTARFQALVENDFTFSGKLKTRVKALEEAIVARAPKPPKELMMARKAADDAAALLEKKRGIFDKAKGAARKAANEEVAKAGRILGEKFTELDVAEAAFEKSVDAAKAAEWKAIDKAAEEAAKAAKAAKVAELAAEEAAKAAKAAKAAEEAAKAAAPPPAKVPSITTKASDKVKADFMAKGEPVKKVKMKMGVNKAEQHTMKDGKKYLVKKAPLEESVVERAYTDFAKEIDSDIVAETGHIGMEGDKAKTVQKWVSNEYTIMEDAVEKAAKGKKKAKVLGDYNFTKDTIKMQKAEGSWHYKATEFMKTTKEGSDWASMDYLFGQVDRHEANMMVKFTANKAKQEIAINSIRLIDNGIASSVDVTLNSSAMLRQNIILNKDTVKGMKKFATKMGWRPGAKNWSQIRENMTDFFVKNYGVKSKETIDVFRATAVRFQALVENDFVLSSNLNQRISVINKVAKGMNIEKALAEAAADAAADVIMEAKVEAILAKDAAKKAAKKAAQAAPKVVKKAVKAAPKPKIRANEQVLKEYKAAGKVKKTVEMSEGMNHPARFDMEDGKKYLVKNSTVGEANMEKIYTDFADEINTDIVAKTADLGKTEVGSGLFDADVAFKKTAQEWTGGSFKAGFNLEGAEVASGDMKHMMRKFALETKKGNDMVVLDWIFQQEDRHLGNWMAKGDWAAAGEAGATIQEIKMIDNGMAMMNKPSIFGGHGLGDIKAAFTKKLKLHSETVSGLKKFAKKMGWKEGVKDWNIINNNIDKYFSNYQLSELSEYGNSKSVTGFKARIRALFDNDFVLDDGLKKRVAAWEKIYIDPNDPRVKAARALEKIEKENRKLQAKIKRLEKGK